MRFVIKMEATNLLLSRWAREYFGFPAESSVSMGCFATRSVNANDQNDAVSAVIYSVRRELSESSVVSPLMNSPDNPLKIRIVSVRTVLSGDTDNAPNAGFTFYPED